MTETLEPLHATHMNNNDPYSYKTFSKIAAQYIFALQTTVTCTSDICFNSKKEKQNSVTQNVCTLRAMSLRTRDVRQKAELGSETWQ